MSKKSVATIKSGSNTSSLSTVRPRSNSSSSARTPIFVAPKKTTMKTVAFGLTTNIEDTVEVRIIIIISYFFTIFTIIF